MTKINPTKSIYILLLLASSFIASNIFAINGILAEGDVIAIKIKKQLHIPFGSKAATLDSSCLDFKTGATALVTKETSRFDRHVEADQSIYTFELAKVDEKFRSYYFLNADTGSAIERFDIDFSKNSRLYITYEDIKNAVNNCSAFEFISVKPSNLEGSAAIK